MDVSDDRTFILNSLSGVNGLFLRQHFRQACITPIFMQLKYENNIFRRVGHILTGALNSIQLSFCFNFNI